MRGAMAAALILTGVVPAAPDAGSHPDSRALVPEAVPGQALPVIRQHTYRMAGRVRMLLLWVGRDDVGSGHITWRAGDGELAYELLIGSDPDRAPTQLNKWGYLIEHVTPAGSSVLGVISQDRTEKMDDVRALKDGDSRGFDTVRGSAVNGAAYARVGTIAAPSSLTYKSSALVLDRVLADQSLPVKRIPRSQGTGSGFLSSLTTLMESTHPRRVRYVHGDGVYDLRVLESTVIARYQRDGRTFENVVRARFETGLAGSRGGTKFELVYGTSGTLANVPIVISYQPKWWLHVDLVLQT